MASDKTRQGQIRAARARGELRRIDEQLLTGCPRRALQVIAKLKVTKDRCVSDAELMKYKNFIQDMQQRKAEMVNDHDILNYYN